MTLVVSERSQTDRLRVIEVDPLADPDWTALVMEHPDALVFHHPNWLHVLQCVSGQTPLGLACVDNLGRYRGVLPLMPTRGVPLLRGSLRAGRRLSSLPQTAIAGPLAFDDGAAQALLTSAVARARALPQTRLEIKAMACDLDQGVEGLTRVPWRLSYVLELPERPEDLRIGNSRHRNQIRRHVRHAEEHGVRLREAHSVDDVRQWYQLYAETMREKLVPPRPLRYFEAIWSLLRPSGMMRLLLAEQHEKNRRRLIAGLLTLRYGQTEFFAWSGRRRADLSLRPNDVLHWRAIHDNCADGFRYYDMGEVSPGDTGLAQFKAKWGCRPMQMWRYYSPGPTATGEESDESGSMVRVAGAVWRRLPLPVTVAVSERIYEYL